MMSSLWHHGFISLRHNKAHRATSTDNCYDSGWLERKDHVWIKTHEIQRARQQAVELLVGRFLSLSHRETDSLSFRWLVNLARWMTQCLCTGLQVFPSPAWGNEVKAHGVSLLVILCYERGRSVVMRFLLWQSDPAVRRVTHDTFHSQLRLVECNVLNVQSKQSSN